MAVKIALAGNPNSGKTTLFNNLTGSSQYVGNWPGVTVEKKEGRVKGTKDIIIQDLPGIYSLSPYTLEEVVTRNYLINERPDAILNIVDASNIERNLYLTTQLMELGLPVVIALNMMDIVRKNGDIINVKKLSEAIGCPIIEASALKGYGSKEAAEKAAELAAKGQKSKPRHQFSDRVEDALNSIERLIGGKVEASLLRWYAIKLFERDQRVMEKLGLNSGMAESIEKIISACEASLDDDSESIITNERYIYIGKVIESCYRKKNKSHITVSDKIDKIVTNRYLAFPIFAAVMFLVYYLSISTIGSWATDWVNDTLFGEIISPAVSGFLVSINCAPWLISLVADGIVGGVGAVLGFLPQMLVLFFFLSILEDCGYMARIAFIMDRIFRKFGLSGKSFIPMLIATGCGVPGVMASRTVENERDRKITIMTTTFMPCGAKLPIIALIAGALFSGSVWVAPAAYFTGIAAIILSGIILKKMKAFAGEASPFVMELPPYHMPSPKNVLLHMWDRGKSFIKKAGTIILLASVLIWFLSNLSWSFQMVEDADESILASLGGFLAPVFAPLGWGDWKSTVAVFTGLVAKENVVSTFGVLYGFSEIAENGAEIWPVLQAVYTPLAAFSFLIFNLLCAPCFAAIGAIRREMGSARWTWIAVGYQTGLAYAVSLCIYQIGMLVTKNSFVIGTLAAFGVILLIVYMLLRPASKTGKDAVRVLDSLKI